jgi:hypothetical protein
VDAGPGAFWLFVFPGSPAGVAQSVHEYYVMMYTFHRFKKLTAEKQIDELRLHGVPFDLAYKTNGAEAVLFGYHNFYVELVVEKYTDNIVALRCFQNTKKLVSYLPQINISEITDLLSCRK